MLSSSLIRVSRLGHFPVAAWHRAEKEEMMHVVQVQYSTVYTHYALCTMHSLCMALAEKERGEGGGGKREERGGKRGEKRGEERGGEERGEERGGEGRRGEERRGGRRGGGRGWRGEKREGGGESAGFGRPGR
jgi:hypothetical protein